METQTAATIAQQHSRARNRTIMTVILGIMFFALIIAVMYFGQTQQKQSEHQGAMGQKPIGRFSNATIAPSHDTKFSPGACKCPSSVAGVQSGAINQTALIGQVKHEGNAPYSFDQCRKDAEEMMFFLQDQELFQYAQSISRNDLGNYPPKQLFYTWDQEAGRCDFFFTCDGMKDCDKTSVASGMVLPQT